MVRFVAVSGPDRAGKDTIIEEIHKQTKFEHSVMNRCPVCYSVFVEYYNRDYNKIDEAMKIDECLANTYGATLILVTANTDDLEQRCKNTNHEILDFDYQKELYNKYFNKSKFKNKLVINTSEEDYKQKISQWINEGKL